MKAGTIVFDRSGRKAEYVAATKGGHIVRPAMIGFGYGDEGEHEYFGDVVTWHEVSTKEPRPVIAGETARLNREIEALSERLSKLRDDERQMEHQAAARAERFRKHTELDRLDEFLTHGFSHLVKFDDYGTVEVKSVYELSDDEQWHDRNIGLVTLSARLPDRREKTNPTEGKITWTINRYRDGSSSGSRQECRPFSNEPDAKAFAAQKFGELCGSTKWKENPYRAVTLSKSARKLGIEAPVSVIAAAREYNLSSARKEVQQARQTLDRHVAALAALETTGEAAS